MPVKLPTKDPKTSTTFYSLLCVSPHLCGPGLCLTVSLSISLCLCLCLTHMSLLQNSSPSKLILFEFYPNIKGSVRIRGKTLKFNHLHSSPRYRDPLLVGSWAVIQSSVLCIGTAIYETGIIQIPSSLVMNIK